MQYKISHLLHYTVFDRDIDNFVIVYIDDILVFSKYTKALWIVATASYYRNAVQKYFHEFYDGLADVRAATMRCYYRHH